MLIKGLISTTDDKKFYLLMKYLSDYREQTDIQLWENIIKGDKLAFEQLYRRYYSPLLSYALSFNIDEDFAKDCIQDLFVKLFLSNTRSRIIYVRAYLYRSFRNIIFDNMKLVFDFQNIDETVDTNCLVEDDELIRLFSKGDEYWMQSKLLIKAFSRLSDNQKNAIYLYYIKEFSWDEMAVTLNITPRSCMNLVARSVDKLRDLVDSLKNK